MIKKMQNYFGITQTGARNVINASIFSFFKYLTFVLPPMTVFFFIQDSFNGIKRPLPVYMGIVAGLAVLIYIVTSLEYRKTYDATYKESTNLRIDLANKIKELPLSYFSTHNLSDLSQTVMMDVNNIEMAISHAIPQGIAFVGFLILMSILFIVNSPILGVCVVGPIWLAGALTFMTRSIQRKNISKYYHTLLENSNSFQEAFEMQQEIKSYSRQDRVRNDVFRDIENSEKIHMKSEFIMGAISAVVGILPYLAPVVTGIIGAILFARGDINVIYFMGYLMAATTFSAQYSSVQEFLLMVIFFGDSVGRIKELKAEPVQKGQDIDINSFDIGLENVEFAYGDNKVINGVSFTARQGEVTALVGPSGCGKTTILGLVSRLYDYDSGKITVGGNDIKNMSTSSLFKDVSIVFQNIDLFDTSVMENIRIGRKDATDKEVLQAAAYANVDDIVAKLPDGYDTVIGENGAKLSGGERQRISIARAFLKNAPIILLDEISASIDVENEMEIQESLNKLIKGKTVIIISHRLKSVEKADKIIVMEEGRINSAGTHDELLKKSALYRTMIEKSRLTEEFVY